MMHYNLAIPLFNGGDFSSAETELSVAIKYSPKIAQYYACRGEAAYYQHKFDSACLDFRLALRLDPTPLSSPHPRYAGYTILVLDSSNLNPFAHLTAIHMPWLSFFLIPVHIENSQVIKTRVVDGLPPPRSRRAALEPGPHRISASLRSTDEMLGELLDVQSSANMKGRATIPVASRSANMWARHLRRRDIQTIARWRKRAASGGAVRLGSVPRPNFGSLSSHRASGIVRHGGHQMLSRQLLGSSRFDRDHLSASDGRAAPRVTRCSPRNE
ncbi:hypothetical protein AURANDRAFT_72182 [Aureococcus anophagefferens]|uniref:Uncharacterized protein n=1 Tax=Aureococcus anophagefferens TaxID=44056 RepID=F0YGT1_AURAN|nr:hypothetical protein AURANDRAFT_72182 [Aureococcus anophagefferens]EGB05749.1 hypothetical protein AURANDRAFT_72182 [Aureococcus anophagefferens]|eukprot:XP_009039588.1 hypothetical protein AURANDRAFT_72182 [Aureococcus anophagefferens]